MFDACPVCPVADPAVTCFARRTDCPDLCVQVAQGVYDPVVIRGLSTGELVPGVPAPYPIPPPGPAEAIDPAEAVRLRRAAKPRVSKGCKSCHGGTPTPQTDPGDQSVT